MDVLKCAVEIADVTKTHDDRLVLTVLALRQCQAMWGSMVG